MKFFNPFIKRNDLVGLDIGVSGIKALQISDIKQPKLLSYNRVALPSDAILPDGDIRNRSVVVEALKNLFKTTDFTTKKVAVGACGNSVIAKKITLPKMTEQELNDNLYWEAEQYLPLNLSEVNLDYSILADTEQNEKPAMDVLLVAAKKDYIQSLKDLTKEANLDLEIIDVQAFAVGNAFEFNYLNDGLNQSYVIIDFGAGTTKVCVVEGDKTVFIRDLSMSGLRCTLSISDALSVGVEEAENMKITPSQEPVKRIIHDFTLALVGEISRSLDYYASQPSSLPFHSVYICGGASLTLGLKDKLEESFKVPVHFLNPLQKMETTSDLLNPKTLTDISVLGTVALGLALRRVDDRA